MRDTTQEQNAIRNFQMRTGRDPNPVDLQDIYKSIYGDQLPPELSGTTMANAGTAATLSPSSEPGANLPGLTSNLNEATGRANQFARPNTALNALQEAIKIKTGGTKAPVGTSETFKQAGVTGYGALQASLGARASEIASDITTYKDIVNNMAGAYKDAANLAYRQLEQANQAYQTEIERVDRINAAAQAHKDAIDLIQIQAETTKRLELYRSQLDQGAIDPFTGDLNLPSDAESIVAAIKQIESGGDYNTRGGAGEFGAYQFLPSTWKGWVDEYVDAQFSEQTPEQRASLKAILKSKPLPSDQDAVALFKVRQLLDAGNSPQEIAAIWNGGAVRKNAAGQYVNTKGVPNVQRYVDRFTSELGRNVVSSGTLTPEQLSDALAKGYSSEDQQKEYLKLARAGIDPQPLKAPTEAQSNAALYAQRMIDSDKVITAIGTKFIGAGSYIGQLVPNVLKSEERQAFEQAQRNFINATLRRESGAAIADSEFKNAALQYFPQPGDNGKVIEQKAQNRKTAIAGIQQAAGPAFASLSGILGEQTGATNEEYPPGTIFEVNGVRYVSIGNGQAEQLAN